MDSDELPRPATNHLINSGSGDPQQQQQQGGQMILQLQQFLFFFLLCECKQHRCIPLCECKQHRCIPLCECKQHRCILCDSKVQFKKSAITSLYVMFRML
ncbi:hypothetical protein BsWGS_03226 [Bradybaena similaris]